MNTFIEIKRRIIESDIAHRIVTGAFWSLAGSTLAKFLVLMSGIICAHILSKNEYGQFGLIKSTINLFVTVGSAGMGVTASKYISEFKVSNKNKISDIYFLTNGFAFVMGLLVTISILLFSPKIAGAILHCSELTSSLRIGALLLFITILNGAQNGTLAGFEDFKSIAYNTLYGSVAESILMLVGAFYYGVFGAVLGFGIGYIVIYIANYFSIKRHFFINKIVISKFTLTRKHLNLLLKFSLPAALASCMTAPAFFIVRTMLSRYSGFEEVAIYEAADQWRIIVLFIPASISQIVLPILSSLSGNRNNTFWRILKINLLLNITIAAVVALAISICSPWIMQLYGESYCNSYTTLIILVSSTIFSAAATVVGAALQSRAKTWISLCFNLLWAVLLIGFTYIFLNRGMGASAISLAFLLSYIAHASFQLIFLKYSLKK